LPITTFFLWEVTTVWAILRGGSVTWGADGDVDVRGRAAQVPFATVPIRRPQSSPGFHGCDTY
jgi:hypothetical protein